MYMQGQLTESLPKMMRDVGAGSGLIMVLLRRHIPLELHGMAVLDRDAAYEAAPLTILQHLP